MDKSKKIIRPIQPLWTRNFTIATLGTVVSMLGNAVSGFALGLLIYSYTNSTLLYAIHAVVTNLPKVIMPSIAGPYLDRFSRRRIIFTLDFISSGVYLLLFLILRFELQSYVLLLGLSLIIGTIDSIYQVAYDSLYPMLISKGNYQKAYSIASLIYPVSALMLPVAAYISDTLSDGLIILFLFNAVTFFVAAIFETQIRLDEAQVIKTWQEETKGKDDTPTKKVYGIKRYVADLKDGFAYLKKERGLLTIVTYFTLNTFANAAIGILILPYFKGQTALGVMTYTYVQGSALLGRVIGGTLHYKIHIPTKYKFTIAMFVYIASNLIGCGYLFVPVVAMLVMQFVSGFICVTSYNIRISSTQNHVPNEMRGRFNGSFQMLTTFGAVIGQLIAGFLGDMLPMRLLVIAFSAVDITAAFMVMFRNREHVKKIYNVDI